MIVAPEQRTTFDPFTLEVLWTRSMSIADEMAATLVRTSFSTIIRVNYDFAAGIFDSTGELLAQASHCAPGQLGSMPTVMHDFLAVYPAETLEPGDVLITNDPWIGSGHSPDLYVAFPIYHRDRLVGFACNSAHHMDVGGSLEANTRDVHEEGLLIPVSKLYQAGRENEMLFRLFRKNVRLPDKSMGDLRAQLAANYVASERVRQLLDEHELDSLVPLTTAVTAQTEAAMRKALSAIPNGTYSCVYPVEERGRDGERLEIRLALTINDGEAIVDYTGTSDQVQRPINCVLNYSRSYSIVGLKMALCPDLPYNAGIQRPVSIVVPEANLLNARFPIAVHGRTAIGQLLPEIVFTALAQVAPERVIAGCGSVPMWVYSIRGSRPNGEWFHEGSHAMGGLGAQVGRDGLSTVAFPYNLADTPSEVMEHETGLLIVEEREFITDSGGPGTYRGGLGQRVTLRIDDGLESSLMFSSSRGRYERGPVGLLGGQDGSIGALYVNDELLPFEHRQVEIGSGDRITLEVPGGGGVYLPLERDPVAVADDVRREMVSVAAAHDIYGVVIDPVSGELDAAATADLRGARARE